MVTKIRIYDVTAVGYLKPLADLLGKAMEQKLLCLVLCANEQQMADFNKLLWQVQSSFLPHGLAAEVDDQQLPICLGLEPTSFNRAEILICCGSEIPAKADLENFSSCCDLVKTDSNNKSNPLQKRVDYYLSVSHDVECYQYQHSKWKKMFCEGDRA